MSYYNLCGIRSQHSTISKGEKGGVGTYKKNYWYARLWNSQCKVDRNLIFEIE